MSFGLEFADKAAVVASLGTPPGARIRAQRARSRGFDAARTILVEGDNLALLQRLQPAYAERFDTIYIDPPYNTGNDFVYRDRFAESAADLAARTGQTPPEDEPLRLNARNDGRYHSAWLAMMYPRLWHARTLMSPEGIICVSIDDHEVHHLRMLLDEIFGEDCFIAQVVVVTNRGGRDYLRIATGHEYLLIYGATPTARIRELPKAPPKSALLDAQGPYVLRELRNRNPRFHPKNRPNLFYPFFVDPSREDGCGGLAVSLTPRPGYEIKVEPRNRMGEGSVWRWGKPKAQAGIVADDPVASTVVAKQRRDGGFNVCEKHRKATAKAKGLWDEPQMRTEQGTLDLRAALGRPAFDHPKPVELIQRCVQLGSDPAGFVLDFFAGSGTTAEAVARADAADAGRRTCVLAQLPEPLTAGGTICDITRERVLSDATASLRVFTLSEDSATAAPTDLEGLRHAEQTRVAAFDVFDRALRTGIGLHAKARRAGPWTVLEDRGRTVATTTQQVDRAAVEASALTPGATLFVPDEALTDAERLLLAERFVVESI